MSRSTGPLLAAASVALAASIATPAVADPAPDVPVKTPKIVVILEDSDRMQQPWSGRTETRWELVRDALLDAADQAPEGVHLSIVMNPNGHGSEPEGYDRRSTFRDSDAQRRSALEGIPDSQLGGADPSMADTYDAVLDHWLSDPPNSSLNWGGPMLAECEEMIVLVVGADVDIADDDDYEDGCDDYDNCRLDEPAARAYASWASPYGDVGMVRTHTMLVDSSQASDEAAPLFATAAAAGGFGLYHPVEDPSDLFGHFYATLQNAADRGTELDTVGGLVVSARGDAMFVADAVEDYRSPIRPGRLLAFELETDRTDPDYGGIVTGSGPDGSQWEAGALLSARPVTAGEKNPNSIDLTGRRTGFTAAEFAAPGSEPIPFDKSSASLLTSMLVDPISLSSAPGCSSLKHDYDGDCDVDTSDVKALIDFVRGVPTASVAGVAIPRGTVRLGSPGNGRPAHAPSNSATAGTDPTFAAYQARLEARPSMVYLATDAGMLHAIDISTSGYEGNEAWFYVPRASLRHGAAAGVGWEDSGAHALITPGRAQVNTGKINLQHVWMDGWISGLPGCGGASYNPADRDGRPRADGCEWHRVVVWSGGPGAKHSYALDVTEPYLPRFLWERADESSVTGRGAGRAVGVPAVAPFVDRSGSTPELRWIEVRTAGSQPPAASPNGDPVDWAHAALSIRDLEDGVVPTTYPSAGLPVPVPGLTNKDNVDAFLEYDPESAQGLFGTPALADLDGDGGVDAGWFGDSEGNLFKVLFNPTSPASPTICHFAGPHPDDGSRAIRHAAGVTRDPHGRVLVAWTTGSPEDRNKLGVSGGLYLREDPTPLGCSASVPPPCSSTDVFDPSGYYDFPGVSEKGISAPIIRSGRLFAATFEPPSAVCGPGGSNLYGVELSTCGGGLYDFPADGHTVTSNLRTHFSGSLSEPVFANGRLYVIQRFNDANAVDALRVTPAINTPVIYGTRRGVR